MRRTRRRTTTLLVSALLVATVSACAAQPSADQWRGSTLILEHEDAAVPPPYHHAWRIELQPNGSGAIRYWPDYPGPGVTPADHRFTVPVKAREQLIEALRAAEVGTRRWPREDPPRVGGPGDAIAVRAPNFAIDIPGRLSIEDGKRLQAVVMAFGRSVPDDVWTELRGL